ncbi:MAG TPA: hypothetical protein VEK33_09335, partial [Terriglobales bacterium]|nr:hypothetical protein [Terriglobales bacterium]
MRECIAIILVLIAILPASSQAPASKYQPGTILAVTRHHDMAGQQHGDSIQYDVSVRVGNTTYVVLYTPPNNANGVEYSAGLGILVMVGRDTLTFNSKLSGTTEVPILHQETPPAQSGLDWSKLPSQYFSMKQQHLSEVLNLTQDQLAQIKPMLEQEAGEAGQVLGNPVLSHKEQLNRWEKIVRSTDIKIKPLLSQAQLVKLQDLRNEQRQELKRIMA